MQRYDVALKLALQQSAVTIRLLAGVVATKFLDVELPKVQNRRADLLCETVDGDFIHLELQSTNDEAVPLRMGEYCLGIYRLYRKFPRQVLLYIGEEPLRMDSELRGADVSIRYRAVDIRDLDGELLLESEKIGDNVIAILARLRDYKEAARKILGRIAALAPDEREAALAQLLIFAGLRRMEETVEQEARQMPIHIDILENKVLGREYKRGLEEGERKGLQEGERKGLQEGELTVLRRQIEARFGPIPPWAHQRLASRSAPELEELSIRVLDAQSLEDLLNH